MTPTVLDLMTWSQPYYIFGQFALCVTWVPYTGTPQTIQAEIDIKETLSPQQDGKGSFIPMTANLLVPWGNYGLKDQFQFVNPATGLLTEWVVIGAPVQRLDGTMDVMVKSVRTIEKAGEGWRGSR